MDISLKTAQCSLTVQTAGDVQSYLKGRDPAKRWCGSRFKANGRNCSFRQSTAAIWATRCRVLFWRLKSEQSRTRPGTIRLRAAVKTGGGNRASSRSLDAETCWGKIALFICTAGLITMLAKRYTISTPLQSLFPCLHPPAVLSVRLQLF